MGWQLLHHGDEVRFLIPKGFEKTKRENDVKNTYIYVYGCEMWHLVSTCVSQTWNILIPVLGLGVG